MDDDHTPAAAPRILFVDDNAVLLSSVERLLRMEGFEVLLASDGIAALETLEGADPAPSLIISDVMMPRMDGFEFFATIRKRSEWLGIPFVFLTARDQIEDLRRGYSLGADDYLVKPLDHERLLLVIRSKLKRKEELLFHIQHQQSALDVAKRNLSQMVAHELRTPLVSISLVSDILAREMEQMGTDQVHNMLSTMREGSLRLSRLVEQMVMYVQLQSGALHTVIRNRVRATALRDSVIGASQIARQFAYRQNSVPIRFQEHDSGVMVCCDHSSLQHAIAEVLANAMMYSSPDGKIRANLWVEETTARVSIADEGRGIPMPEVGHVFEPYYQVDRARYEQQGIGIGLTLARGIIEAHEGTIDLRSTEDVGTTVTIVLPVSGDKLRSD